MPQVNYAKREAIVKIVYYGPAYSGKTSSLYWLYNKLDPQHVKELHTLSTDEDRTLFFDLLPVTFTQLNKMKLKLKLYTVPGQVKYNSTRQAVLKGADAVVFVADSDATRYQENSESLKNLADNLRLHGINIDKIPLVMQYNKRDARAVLPIEVMDQMFNPRKCPSVGSIAISHEDQGVLEGFIAILTLMIQSFAMRYHLNRNDEEIQELTDRLASELRHQMKPWWDLKV
jgi:signal recognition particle receptor subunit beta